MIRLIKRYGSRKLYDTEESRYVSLEELAAWIRHGTEIRVVDNKTAEDVTSQTLTQIISEEGRHGRTLLPNELLHELIRLGEEAVSSGVEQLQTGVDRLVQVSMDRLGPVRRAREEMGRLRERLADLEESLVELEQERQEPPAPAPAPARTRRPAAKASTAKAKKGASTTKKAGSTTRKASTTRSKAAPRGRSRATKDGKAS